MSSYYSDIRCILCNISVSNVLFTVYKKVNIDCYDNVSEINYVFCNVYSVCTTSMKLVKNTNITSSIYSEARFEKV